MFGGIFDNFNHFCDRLGKDNWDKLRGSEGGSEWLRD